MPRPKNKTYDDPPEGATVIERNVEDFVGQFGGEAYKIKIFKFDEQGTRKWKATLGMIALNEDIIYRKFGPGKYYLVMVDEGGKYLKKEHAGQMIALTIDIEGPEEGGEDYFRAQPQQVMQPGNDPMMTMLMQQMADARSEAIRAREQADQSQQRMHEMMIAVISRPQAVNGSDPALMIGALTSAMASMKQLTGGDSGNDISKLKDLVELANTLKSDGSGSDDDSPTKLLASGLKILPQLIAGRSMPVEVQSQPVRPVNLVPGADNPPFIAKDLEVSHPYLLLIDRLVNKARNGRDAGLQADAVVDDGDEGNQVAFQFIQKLVEAGSYPAWRVGEMKGIITDDLSPWFQEFYETVLDQLSGDEPIPEKPEEPVVLVSEQGKTVGLDEVKK